MTEEPTSLLPMLSAHYGGKVQECLHFDANVCKSESDPVAPWRRIAVRGMPFSLRLSLVHRGKRIGLMASREYLQISIKGTFPWEPFTINAEEHIGFKSKLTAFRIGEHPVFTSDGEISSVQAKLLRNPRLSQLINDIQLEKGDSLHFYRNAITLYIVRPVESRAKAALEGLITISVKVQISQREELNLSKLPKRFRRLVPLVEKWAIDDDLEREEIVRGSSKTILRFLIKRVEPDLGAIDSYLDSFGADAPSPEAAALGRLAECALEAKKHLETER